MDLRAVLHIGISVAMSGQLTAGQIASMKTEVATIWERYGVRFTWLDHVHDCNLTDLTLPPIDALIDVIPDVHEAARPAGAPVALGTVRAVDLASGRTVHLVLPPVTRLVLESKLAGVPVSAWPAPMRDHALGQALGRVLAHELGHLLLALPTHTSSGLMRASLSGADLIAPGHEHVTLGKALVDRLKARRPDAAAGPAATQR